MTTTATRTFTEQEISTAVNKAVDDVLDAIDGGETGVRDTLGLVANASLHYLEHPGDDLDDVAEMNYSVPLSTILTWIDS